MAHKPYGKETVQEAGRSGGKQTSDAKSKAAEKNGAKGGRPDGVAKKK